MASEKIHIGVALFLGILMLLVFSVGVNDYRITGNPVDEGDNDTEILGCMDDTALNYNAEANTDDDSCTYDVVEVLGCIDDTALNYNAEANTDDDSCTYDVVEGCMDNTAVNFISGATIDDGSCISEVLGCVDDGANNYNEIANTDDDSCTYDVEGCIDSSANNYNDNANLGDGSCTYDDDSSDSDDDSSDDSDDDSDPLNSQSDEEFEVDSTVNDIIRELEESQVDNNVDENSGDVSIDEINQLTGGVIGDDSNSNITCDEGCILNERCYSVERRKNATYCSNETISWVVQKAINETCSNNFECVSNSCKIKEILDCEGEECSQDKFCTEAGFIKKFFNWLKLALRIE